jgi:hypothetical protein
MKTSDIFIFEAEDCGGSISYSNEKARLTITVINRPKELNWYERLEKACLLFSAFLWGKKNVETSVVIDRLQAKEVRRFLEKKVL